MEKKDGMEKFEEFKQVTSRTSWIIIIVASAAIVGWGVMTYFLIPDVPRQWDYGILPDTPAESIYSTVRPEKNVSPSPQIPPLPEARPPKTGANP